MAKKWLVTASAAALLACASVSYAQRAPLGNESPSAGSTGAQSSAPVSPAPGEKTSPGAAKSGSSMSPSGSAQNAPQGGAMHNSQSTQSTGPKSAEEQKSGSSRMGQSTSSSKNAQSAEEKAGADKTMERDRNSAGSKTNEQMGRNGARPNENDAGQNAADRSSNNTSVTLTTEQRTRIRDTVIHQANAPRINRDQVNFSLNVGSVVPRSVHVAVLPAAVVEIHPQWRGYQYILVGDELVILEPGTLRIVAIIPA